MEIYQVTFQLVGKYYSYLKLLLLMNRLDKRSILCTYINNALAIKKWYIIIRFHKLYMKVLQILKFKHLIDSFIELTFEDVKKQFPKDKIIKYWGFLPWCIVIYLRYNDNKSILKYIKLVSKPSRYVSTKKHVKCIKNGYAFYIISTSKGTLKTSKQCKLEGIGGEIMFEVSI